MTEQKYCQICAHVGRKELAIAKAKTVYGFFANLCQNCLTIHSESKG